MTYTLARIPGKTRTILTECPVQFDHPEDFHSHLLHVMRHGGTLIVEQHLDDGFLGQAIYSVTFYHAMMKILSHEETKKYHSSGVVYGDFTDFLQQTAFAVGG